MGSPGDFFGPRLKALWEHVRDQKVGDLYDRAKFWTEAVAHGADPIEAIHGHLCGPECMHWETISAERKARLRKAPWNQGR
jgi:hypothetical protein